MKARKEYTIKRGMLYRLYNVNGDYFVEDYTRPATAPAPGFTTLAGAMEYIKYNELETEFDPA